MEPPVCYVTGRQAGSSDLAARIARRILNMDGFAAVRQGLQPEYDVDAFGASLARLIDQEIWRAKPNDAIPVWIVDMVREETESAPTEIEGANEP